jgi:hypothetical protein
MTKVNPMLKQYLRQITVWAAVVAFNGAAAFPQVSDPAATAVAEHADHAAPINVLEDTLIRVMTSAPINSKRVKDSTPLLFTVSEDVKVGDVLAIPRGATIHGVVIKSRKAGVLTGSPELTIELVSLELGGRSYPLYTYPFQLKGTSKTGPTETKVKGGAVVGAIVGGAFSGSAKGGTTGTSAAAGMATGAAVGAGVGTMVSAATPGPAVWIPSETQVDFYLASPISVRPVSAEEAARLAKGFRAGGPTLFLRSEVP